ncbi:hypothetical protein FNH22_03445 [Fulvivirga sp. M361]|uniref:hypothetical protein n=1 Tax=Fulvivirga sp. M361 TaxID=2594266 RepID=UPI00117BD280|nr:hypothetical protein [Fulvivirga sp. M361]TRX61842.1 hypothetical protein FNH22_03445 [Fulvivirga sp. M361]
MLLKEFKDTSGKAYAIVHYEEETDIISDVWNGVFGSQDNFKEVLVYVQEQILARNIKKWLADLRNMQGSFDGSKDWIAEEIMSKLIKNGELFQAIVLPNNIFAKLSARDTIKKVSNYELKQFHDPEEARNWLVNVKVISSS